MSRSSGSLQKRRALYDSNLTSAYLGLPYLHQFLHRLSAETTSVTSRENSFLKRTLAGASVLAFLLSRCF